MVIITTTNTTQTPQNNDEFKFDDTTHELSEYGDYPEINWIKVLSCQEGETSSTGVPLSIHRHIYHLARLAYTFKIVPSSDLTYPKYKDYTIISVPHRSPIRALNRLWDPSCKYDFNQGIVLDGTDLDDFFGSPEAKQRANNPTYDSTGGLIGGCQNGDVAHAVFGICGGIDWSPFYRADGQIPTPGGIWVANTWGGVCYWEVNKLIGENMEIYFGFTSNQTADIEYISSSSSQDIHPCTSEYHDYGYHNNNYDDSFDTDGDDSTETNRNIDTDSNDYYSHDNGMELSAWLLIILIIVVGVICIISTILIGLWLCSQIKKKNEIDSRNNSHHNDSHIDNEEDHELVRQLTLGSERENNQAQSDDDQDDIDDEEMQRINEQHNDI